MPTQARGGAAGRRWSRRSRYSRERAARARAPGVPRRAPSLRSRSAVGEPGPAVQPSHKPAGQAPTCRTTSGLCSSVAADLWLGPGPESRPHPSPSRRREASSTASSTASAAACSTRGASAGSSSSPGRYRGSRIPRRRFVPPHGRLPPRLAIWPAERWRSPGRLSARERSTPSTLAVAGSPRTARATPRWGRRCEDDKGAHARWG